MNQLKLDLVLDAHHLAGPLDQLDEIVSSAGEINLPSGPDLLLGELMMVSLLFSSSDNELAESEISLINEIAQAIKGDEAEEINATNFIQIFKKLSFQVKITDAGNDTYGAWRDGTHDDLVLAVALACWAARHRAFTPLAIFFFSVKAKRKMRDPALSNAGGRSR